MGLYLRELCRMLIPQSMRGVMLQKIHEGHMGITKCQTRALESLYWPGISMDIKGMVERCPTCIEYSPAQPKETLIPHDIPRYPWQKVGADLFSIKDKNYLVVADYFSLYPEVSTLSKITTTAVKNVLTSIFSRHGIPEILYTDNGPNLNLRNSKHLLKIGSLITRHRVLGIHNLTDWQRML